MHAWIRLFGMITQQSVTTLMKTVDVSVATGTTKLHMLFSSSGGNVFCGLSTYNYLKALPIKIASYNISQVDSIAVPIFCAGAERICTQNGRFMIHEVTYFANAGQQLTLRTLRAIHASILSDTNAIAKVIAATIGEQEAEVF
jgi:ATP-dependent protease ClpP protease subunit